MREHTGQGNYGDSSTPMTEEMGFMAMWDFMEDEHMDPPIEHGLLVGCESQPPSLTPQQHLYWCQAGEIQVRVLPSWGSAL